MGPPLIRPSGTFSPRGGEKGNKAVERVARQRRVRGRPLQPPLNAGRITTSAPSRTGVAKPPE